MLRKFAAVSAAVTLFVFVGLFSVGSVFAQTATPPAAEAPAAEAPATPWGGAWNRICRGAGVVSDAIAELLGLTPEEIQAERLDGKSLSDIAEAQGVTDEALIEAIIAARTEAIEQAVADGALTRERADLMLERMAEMVPSMLDREMGSMLGPAGRRGMKMGGDMPRMGRAGGRGQGCTGVCPLAPDADDTDDDSVAPQGLQGMRGMRGMHDMQGMPDMPDMQQPGMRGFGMQGGNF